jgi:hypothetical protein
MDCFASLAMTWIQFRILAAPCTRGLHVICPSKRRGRRECRVLAAPAVSCAMCTRKCAHEHTGTAGAARHSLRSGFTAYTALSPETNSSCLRRRRIEGLSKPGWVDFSSAGLTPATGARTTRLCRTLQRQSSARCVRSQTEARPANTTTRPTLPRPPQPAPTFVTMANAPLPGRDGGSCKGDLGLARRSIFFQSRLDRANHVEAVAENRFCAHRLFARSCKIKERHGRSALARRPPMGRANARAMTGGSIRWTSCTQQVRHGRS